MSFEKLSTTCKSRIHTKQGFICFKNKDVCSQYNECCNLNHTNPSISSGNTKPTTLNAVLTGYGSLTSQQTTAIKYYNELNNYQSVADRMGMSKTNARKLVIKALNKIGGLRNQKNILNRGVTHKQRGITQRGYEVSLHNDSISFQCDTDFNKLAGEIKKLTHTIYKFYKSDEHIIKIFEKKIVIQFRKEIISESTDECLILANQRILNFTNSLKMDGLLRIYNLEQLSRHYAILGTDIAKKYITERKQLFIYDPKGNKRVIIDFSDKDKKGGMPHLEFPNKDYGKQDTDANKEYIEDITFNQHYKPSVTKYLVDTILNTQKEYAEQIKLHLEVQKETLKTLKVIREGLKR